MINNILITSVGQRVTLTEIFQKTAKDLGLDTKVYTTDMDPTMAPAGYISDKCFQVSKCTDSGYVDDLITICKDNDIHLIIPTIDTELAVLAENKSRFTEDGIHVMVSDIDFIRTCRDKRRIATFLAKLGIQTPKPADKYHPVFPMFAKPYDGSLSTNLHVIRNADELTPEILNDPKLIFMEYIDKNEFKEFTVDMYYGKDHYVKGIVPRERLKIRAGEINKGITRKNGIVGFLKQRMSYLPGVIGCICIQLFYRESDAKIFGIEINPRFGGGYPLSYYAKANFADYMLREYVLHESVGYSDDWLDNTLMLRYDKDVIVYDK